MNHLQDKNDWLTYEFKPYFFFIIGVTALLVKKNLTLTTSQNFIAYICIASLFIAGVKILTLRSDYRARTSRK